MFNYLQQRRRNKQLREFEMPPAEWRYLMAQPLFAGLDDDEQERLRQQVIWFLHEKAIFGVDDEPLSPYQKLSIAAQACLPVLNLDVDSYADWKSVIVYPGAFQRHERFADQYGLVHEGQRMLAGEARQDGPVLLSWSDVNNSLACDGWNVVIHEMAHKLDMKNGGANGYPPLHRGMSADVWTREFRSAYLDFCQRVDMGQHTGINSYGATNPGEFFAVISEYFFELPQLLQQLYPPLYQLLTQFYRQDPLTRQLKAMQQHMQCAGGWH